MTLKEIINSIIEESIFGVMIPIIFSYLSKNFKTILIKIFKK